MTQSARPPNRLPDRPRAVAILCLGVAGLVGMMAAGEAFGLAGLSEARNLEVSGFGGVLDDPKLWKRALNAQISALESMRDARLVVLAVLAIASALTFSAAARLLWPAGLPREGMRRLLGGAALVAGIARTLDGAQSAVVHRQYGLALQQAILENDKLKTEPGLPSVAAVMPAASVAWAIATTVLMVGAFLFFSAYFRSEKLKELVAIQDRRLG